MYFSLVSNILEPQVNPPDTSIYRKLSANTTLGYFEIPSRLNEYRAGPLLGKDPYAKLGGALNNWKRADKNITAVSPAAPATERNIVGTRKLGPLSSLGLALFSYRSFLGARMRNATSFTEAGEQWPAHRDQKDENCAYLAPFLSFCTFTQHDGAFVAAEVFDYLTSFDKDGAAWLSQGLNLTNYLFMTGWTREDMNKR